MAEFLDKTGLAYFWSKIKAKLNNKANESEIINIENQLKYKVNRNELNGKADLNQYQVRTISTNKFKFTGIISENSYSNDIYLYKPDQNNFAESLPSGCIIMCILAVKFAYFKNETDYNNNTDYVVSGNYNILPVTDDGSNTVQTWNVLTGNTMSMYGAKICYTLLIKMPLLPVG